MAPLGEAGLAARGFTWKGEVELTTNPQSGFRTGRSLQWLGPLRRWVVAVERGRTVRPSVLITSRPWAPLVLVALVLGVWSAGTELSQRLVALVTRSWAVQPLQDAAGALPVPLSVPVAVLTGVVVFLGAPSWSWLVRLAILAATWGFAAHALGLTSSERVGDVVHWLASQPGVDVFDPPPRGSVDATVVVVFSLVLAPFIVGLLFLMLWAWSSFAAEFIRPLAFGRALPDWVLMAVVLTGLAVAAYAARAIWLPWCVWVLGVVARAIVIQWGG